MSQGLGTSAPGVCRRHRLAGGVRMVLAALLGLSLAGVWTTWRFYGRDGLVAAAWAGGVNLVVFVLSFGGACWVARRKGLLAAGKAFMYTGVVRVGLVVGIAFLAAATTGAGGTAYWLWTGGLYVALLMVQALWLARSFASRCGG